MANYIVRRLVVMAVMLWAISIVVFAMMRVGPGNPALAQAGLNASPAQVAALEKEMHLDESHVQQYGRWIAGLGTLDLGRSALTTSNTADEFLKRLPVTLELVLLTIFWTVGIGILLGVLSACKPNSLLDYMVRTTAIFGLSVPNFWVATLVLLVPVQLWGYAPPLDGAVSLLDSPLTNLRQFGPPSFVLALGPIATMMRLSRSSLLEVLRADYIRTARAKGIKQQTVILRHALKNSLVPVVTVLGLLIGGLLGGTIIIENIFGLNGLSQFLYSSVLQRDYAVAQTLVLYSAAAALFMTLIVDLVYVLLDPRIRYT